MPRNLRYGLCEKCSYWPSHGSRSVHQSNLHSLIPPSCMACPRNDHFPLHAGASASIHLGHSMVYLPRDLANEHARSCATSLLQSLMCLHRSNFKISLPAHFMACFPLTCMARSPCRLSTCRRISTRTRMQVLGESHLRIPLSMSFHWSQSQVNSMKIRAR